MRAPVVLCCPDKFRGSLTAREAAEALAAGVARTGRNGVALPLADGGEGTLEVLCPDPADRRTAPVTGPLGELVEAEWGLRDGTAVVEMARASGLALTGAANDPLRATTDRHRRADPRGARRGRRPRDRRRRRLRDDRRRPRRARGARLRPRRRRRARRLRRLDDLRRGGAHLRPAEGCVGRDARRSSRSGSPRSPSATARSSASTCASSPAREPPAGSPVASPRPARGSSRVRPSSRTRRSCPQRSGRGVARAHGRGTARRDVVRRQGRRPRARRGRARGLPAAVVAGDVVRAEVPAGVRAVSLVERSRLDGRRPSRTPRRSSPTPRPSWSHATAKMQVSD